MNLTIQMLVDRRQTISTERTNSERARIDAQRKLDHWTNSVRGLDAQLADLDTSLTILKASALINDETKGAGQ